MRLISRIRFALKYDFDQEFIVVPFGEDRISVRFFNYDLAERFCSEEAGRHPQHGKPAVLVIVRRRS